MVHLLAMTRTTAFDFQGQICYFPLQFTCRGFVATLALLLFVFGTNLTTLADMSTKVAPCTQMQGMSPFGPLILLFVLLIEYNFKFTCVHFIILRG